MTRRAWILVMVLALLTSSPSWAQGGAGGGTVTKNTPATVLQSFWQSVADQDYATSWKLLTLRTQREFVGAVSKDAKMSKAEIQSMFAKNDARLKNGFWKSFRESSHADGIAQGNYKSGKIQNGKCSVTINGVKARPVWMYLEKGAWKVGYVETFFPKGLKM